MFHIKHYKEYLYQDEPLAQNYAVDKHVYGASIVQQDCCIMNNLSFYNTCATMESVWKAQSGKLGLKVECLLPNDLVNIAKQECESLYPLLRLYCPEKDNDRKYNVDENVIAQAYCDALGLEELGGIVNLKEWRDLAKMLHNFTDAEICSSDVVGDLSLVVEHVMDERTNYTQSKLRLGDINGLLDEFAALNPKERHHQYKSRGNKENITPNAKPNLAEWFRKVIYQEKLSPMEHKWLVRIIIKKPDFGIQSTSILRAVSPYANGLLAADGNLKRMCDKLAGPYFE
ncbi:unnamed protein product [Cylindrotheca closterium]|uniref:DNA ligase ATP-dependent N-terminal domain-containing protein n=1 Tax=Cylindrotheca closterium TaxID=2856 RepID=A0AAD2FQT0_9STRA|nr:unnamed protein product [Cylindrotheca closterium]